MVADWVTSPNFSLRVHAELSPALAAEAAPSPAWFCLRSQPKHEHIAARQLRQVSGVEVFLPRIRFRRKTRQGVVWVTEALFPNYLLARFDWHTQLRLVHHARGISCVVHFGSQWPTVPVAAIEELRRSLGPDELHVVSDELAAGDPVRIATGPFAGLAAVVTHALPGRQRVAVLLEFLGRQTKVELPPESLLKQADPRQLEAKP